MYASLGIANILCGRLQQHGDQVYKHGRMSRDMFARVTIILRACGKQ